VANTGDGGQFNAVITMSKSRDHSTPLEVEVCMAETLCVKKMLDVDATTVAKSSDDVINYLADVVVCLSTVGALLDDDAEDTSRLDVQATDWDNQDVASGYGGSVNGDRKRGWSNLPDFARRLTAQNRQLAKNVQA